MKAKEMREHCEKNTECTECRFYKIEICCFNNIEAPYNWNDEDCLRIDKFVKLMSEPVNE